jgi:hypothetical protein
VRGRRPRRKPAQRMDEDAASVPVPEPALPEPAAGADGGSELPTRLSRRRRTRVDAGPEVVALGPAVEMGAEVAPAPAEITAPARRARARKGPTSAQPAAPPAQLAAEPLPSARRPRARRTEPVVPNGVNGEASSGPASAPPKRTRARRAANASAADS